MGQGVSLLSSISTMSDFDGYFLLESLKPDSYELWVSQGKVSGLKKVQVELKPGEKKKEIDLFAPRLQGIQGRVLDMDSERPVSGVQVFAQNEFGSKQTETDANGYFSLR